MDLKDLESLGARVRLKLITVRLGPRSRGNSATPVRAAPTSPRRSVVGIHSAASPSSFGSHRIKARAVWSMAIDPVCPGAVVRGRDAAPLARAGLVVA